MTEPVAGTLTTETPHQPIYSMFGQKKSDRALRAAIDQHFAGLWRFALSLSGNPDTADDLAQAACMRALERSHQIQNQDRLDAWLMTICRSIWLNEMRAQSIRKAQSLAATPDQELIAQTLDAETNIFAVEVFTQVMDLPEAQRAAVLLVFVEGFSYREAAEILEVPIGTIMSRLASARAKLRASNDAATGLGQ